jgi:hypothetical protein
MRRFGDYCPSPYVRHTKHVSDKRAQKPKLSDGQTVLECNLGIASQRPLDGWMAQHILLRQATSQLTERSKLERGGLNVLMCEGMRRARNSASVGRPADPQCAHTAALLARTHLEEQGRK